MTKPAPLFGINIHPGIDDLDDAFRRARLADAGNVDLVTVQDHPYIAHFLDTWTLLTALATITERVRLGTNVSPIPLRPPAMLAKAAASLGRVSGGRAELGIGAGGYEMGLRAFGGEIPPRPEIVPAFEEAVQVIRGLWESRGGFTFEGEHYRLKGARFGPKPSQPIRLWVGAARPRMLRLTGRLADGVLVSNTYVPPERLAAVNRWIDEGAARAGRPPEAIRRGYNLMGAVDLPGRPNESEEIGPDTLVRTAEGWIDYLIYLGREHRIDTFIFWPLGDHQFDQLATFVGSVIPAVRAALTTPAR